MQSFDHAEDKSKNGNGQVDCLSDLGPLSWLACYKDLHISDLGFAKNPTIDLPG